MKLLERQVQESQEHREFNMLHAEFEKLYQRHDGAVWNKAYACCGDYDIADDAVHYAYLQLWMSLLSGKKITNPLPLLCRIAGNKAKDMVKHKFRRNGTHPPAIMNAVASKEPSVLHALAR